MSSFRFLKAYSVTLRVLLSYLLFRITTTFRGEQWSDRARGKVHSRNARRITRMILELQGLYIKVGQLVSILTNFLPETFRSELEELQDSIPPGPVKNVAERIQNELGQTSSKLFTTFNPEAIASASLAQVHEATLPDGQHVAVKVQHPNIEETARQDLRTIRSILNLIGKILGVRGIEEQYSQLEEMIHEELDFEQEGRNLELIAANFANDPDVDFPTVFHSYSSRRVLTTAFVEGVKVSDTKALEALGIKGKDLAEKIVAAYCRMIFVDGVYHADPHPGNILVRPDGRIVFLDFGAVAHLSPEMKQGIPEFLVALLKRDVGGLRNALFSMGFIAREERESEAMDTLDHFHEQLFERLNLEAFTLGEMNAESTMEMKMTALNDLRSLDVSFRQLTTAFRVPKDWLLLERTMLLLIGLCTHLDPTMNPLTTLRPYLQEYVLGPENNWRDTLSDGLRDMAITAITLPDELRKLLTSANSGKLETRVRGLQESARLIYALGHQILYGIFALAAGGLAYASHIRGEESIRDIALWVGCFFLLILLLSMIRAKRHTQ